MIGPLEMNISSEPVSCSNEHPLNGFTALCNSTDDPCSVVILCEDTVEEFKHQLKAVC